ncbi:hypothetical protein ACQP1G_17095 [Nocardia sp. CA-107356]|uniref:hypothetical protein n=1 Tax=Nocardia sp. CA-107356 TaxID=3239972 RepID=UPI003D91EACE
MTGAQTDGDRLLNSGTDGLRFFEVFLPRYQHWTGGAPAGGNYSTLAARYDQERGMDIRWLHDFATMLQIDQLTQEAGVQSARFTELADHWSESSGANAVQHFMGTVQNHTHNTTDTVRGIQKALASAAEQLENVVRHKADIARIDFVADAVAGKTPAEIDRIIDYAHDTVGGSEDSKAKAVRTLLPDYPEGATNPEAYCGQWLNQVFVPAVNDQVTAFTKLCDATHTAVTGLYDKLAKAFNGLDPAGYTSPGGHLSANTDLVSNIGRSRYHERPVSTSLASTIPASTIPDKQLTSPAATTPPATTDPTQAGNPSAPNTAPAITGTSIAAKTNTTTDKAPAPADKAPAPADKAPAPADKAPAPADKSDKGTPGVWRPGDISAMVDSASKITGSIPDNIKAVASLIDSADKIVKDGGTAVSSVIKTGGEAAVNVIHAMDHQPATHDPGAAPHDSAPKGDDTKPPATAAPATAAPASAGDSSQHPNGATSTSAQENATPVTETSTPTPALVTTPASVTPDPRVANTGSPMVLGVPASAVQSKSADSSPQSVPHDTARTRDTETKE